MVKRNYTLYLESEQMDEVKRQGLGYGEVITKLLDDFLITKRQTELPTREKLTKLQAKAVMAANALKECEIEVTETEVRDEQQRLEREASMKAEKEREYNSPERVAKRAEIAKWAADERNRATEAKSILDADATSQ